MGLLTDCVCHFDSSWPTTTIRKVRTSSKKVRKLKSVSVHFVPWEDRDNFRITG